METIEKSIHFFAKIKFTSSKQPFVWVKKNYNYSESELESNFDSNLVSDPNSDSNSVFINLDVFVFFFLYLHSSKRACGFFFSFQFS